MKYIQIIFMLCIMFGCTEFAGAEAEADQDVTVTIKKTFDFGTLIEHEIIARNKDRKVCMRFSQRRKEEGAEEIDYSHISYSYLTNPSGQSGFLTLDEQRIFVINLMNRLHKELGTDLKIQSLNASGYLGVKETEEKGILAFKDFQPWETHIKDPKHHTQWEIHETVLNRWKEKGVFSDIIKVFKEIGYSLELSGFEKLFIHSAGECDFYPELEKSGIKKEAKFPYPGTISFTVKKLK